MRLILSILLLVAGLTSCAVPKDFAQGEQATPAEVVSKVRKAAALLSKQGVGGLEVLRDSSSEFTWKDTYVFVVNCDADIERTPGTR